MARRRKRTAPTYLTERTLPNGESVIVYQYGVAVEHRGVRRSRRVYRQSDEPYDWQASLRLVQEHRAATRAALVDEIDSDLDAAGREAAPTLRDLAEAWLADARARGLRLVDVETSRVGIMLETLTAGGDLAAGQPAAALTAADVRRWRDALAERPVARARRPRTLSPASVNAYLSLLSMVLSLAVRDGRLDRNVCRQVQRLARANPDSDEGGDVRVLTHAQMAAVFAALSSWEREQALAAERRKKAATGVGKPSLLPLRGLVLVGYYTLARTRDVRALRWSQVDRERRTITWANTKNTRRTGIVVRAPIGDALLAYLETLDDSGEFVFPNPETGLPFVEVRHGWQRLLEIANADLPADAQIDLGFRMYNLRHTGASHLAASGAMSPLEIAELMGDTSVETVRRRYFQVDLERLRRRLAKVPEADAERAAVDRAARGHDVTRDVDGGDKQGLISSRDTSDVDSKPLN